MAREHLLVVGWGRGGGGAGIEKSSGTSIRKCDVVVVVVELK